MIVQRDLTGWWRRAWLKTTEFEDATSHVHWAQSDAIYVDLRVPEMPGVVGDRVSDLSAAALLEVLAAEGFAGAISVQDGVCTWRRDINWHGASDFIDAGRMSFGDDGDLYEDGVHLDYAERWTKASCAPLSGRRVLAGERTGFLTVSKDAFAFGAGREGAASSEALIAALAAGRTPDGLAQHFQSEFMIGRWDGERGIIDLSTTPFRGGEAGLLRGPDGAVTWLAKDMDGQVREIPLR